MSRRKQPNPNKVKHMERSSEEKRAGDGLSAAGSEDKGLSEGAEQHLPSTPTQHELRGKPESEAEEDRKVKKENRKAEKGGMEREAEEQEKGEEEGEDLSSINSMMTTVMNAGQINGGVDPASTASPTKTPSKCPAVNRTGRRNQEVKEERSTFICPLCDKNCMTQHNFTMHIRQHNTDSSGTDHSCSICGKALSSASSLDRHMLVHSGERPYKCSVCGQTFTTNGNMHRHSKIHIKDPSSVPASSPPSPNKRRRPSAKRKPSLEDEGERVDQQPNKKVLTEHPVAERGPAKGEEELLHCPICFKTFICKYGLESHMETHPDTTLRCNLCCITFRTHRGLLRHNSVIHKQLPTDPTGRPFIQSNPSIPLGFSDLAFIDFSCQKFPRIAQVWCETNLRRCSSKFHRFVCEVCNKAFPLQVSLDLHAATHSASADAVTRAQKPSANAVTDACKPSGSTMKEVAEPGPCKVAHPSDGKAGFMESLGLQLTSQVKPAQSEEEIQQAILDRIRVIHVEPPATNLPQEANSSLGLPLLEPISLQGMSQNSALSLMALQPFQRGFVNSGMVLRPTSGQVGVELADIQQILKMAVSVPSQMTLPPLPKTPGNPAQAADPKQVLPLKPKPLVTPRSSMGTSTPPPPVMSAQQASSGCISPSLPPPTGQLLRTPRQSSSSTSSSSSSPNSQGYNWENTQLGADGIMSYDPVIGRIKQEDMGGKDREARAGSGKKTPVKAEYPCRFCTQVFSFPGGLQAHMRHHLGASPYQCSICSYGAPDNATLIRHLRTHSGERPYVCRLCHYPFTVKANCERHLRKKHMKNTRKEIEKNIEYVTSSSSVSGMVSATTLDPLDPAGSGNTACRYCGEDLKSYRALQIHLRTHNGCQRKPFECRRCGAAFLAKRNCIHHLLKQHPEVPEREIEEHINALVPVTAATTLQSNPPLPSSNGLLLSALAQPGKQDLSLYTGDQEQDQPLDFSNKTHNSVGSNIKQERVPSPQPAPYDCSMEPMDLSIPKDPEKKKLKRELAEPMPLHSPATEVKKELISPSTEKPPEASSSLHAPIQLSLPGLVSPLSSDPAKPSTRLKPLLPKPSTVSTTVELPPLASIAQIISSVSAAPALLKTSNRTSSPCGVENSEGQPDVEALSDKTCPAGTVNPDTAADISPVGKSKRKRRKRSAHSEVCDAGSGTGSGIDLESSGEFPSVEKMLATTDATKFSPYLQRSQVEPAKEEAERERQSASEEEREGKEDKQKLRPQSKGKKNAYSNSVQKMTCPYCPRVFPWASSLQRHMLTHTGQKPYPCPQCDAFFSTKSNCERHLLRKHGVANRTLQQNGSHLNHKGDEGSQGSSESMSDTEPTAAGDSLDLSSDDPKTEELAPGEQPGLITAEQTESDRGSEGTEPIDSSQEENDDDDDDDDDAQSNKSLDLNLARKLIDFKLSAGEQSESQTTRGALEPESTQEFQHTCTTCKKSFRHAATLSRHQKTHLQEIQPEDRSRKGRRHAAEASQSPSTTPKKEEEQEEKPAVVERETNSSSLESGAEEDEKEKEREERSDEEDEDSGSSEVKGVDGEGRGAGGKADKRKKICSVCSKRFWSLQDLTRHMRSHTGERPYKCQTCERTFTLKHSLVRHQRIHQKPQDCKEAEGAEDEENGPGSRDDPGAEEGEGGTRCPSGSESESTPGSSTPLSENESEGAGTGPAAEEVEEEEEEKASKGPREERETKKVDVVETTGSSEEPPREAQTDMASSGNEVPTEGRDSQADAQAEAGSPVESTQ